MADYNGNLLFFGEDNKQPDYVNHSQIHSSQSDKNNTISHLLLVSAMLEYTLDHSAAVGMGGQLVHL